MKDKRGTTANLRQSTRCLALLLILLGLSLRIASVFGGMDVEAGAAADSSSPALSLMGILVLTPILSGIALVVFARDPDG